MASFKITNNTTGYKDVNVFGNKFYCHQQQIFDIGTDAGTDFESLVKIDSLPIPARVEVGQKMILKSVHFNYHFLAAATKTAKVLSYHIEDWAVLQFNPFMFCAITSENLNSSYALGAGAEHFRNRANEKVLILFPNEMHEGQDHTFNLNLEMIKATKLSYLNVYTNFGFLAGLDYAAASATLLAYLKINYDNGLTAGVYTNFLIHTTYEFEICDVKRKKPVKIRRSVKL